MYTKIHITGDILVRTGLHIGTNDSFAAIGAIDSPVVRDGFTGDPIIPGSSLKGKMRTLLARLYNNGLLTGDPESDPDIVTRLYGATRGGGDDGKSPIPSRLSFADAFITNKEDFGDFISLTEAKSENTISRLTSVANPRQIERVVPGVRFGLDLMYDVHCEEHLEEDFKAIAQAMRLLSADYLGGHGTRGSGRVVFENIHIEQIDLLNKLDDKILHSLKEVLNDDTVRV